MEIHMFFIWKFSTHGSNGIFLFSDEIHGGLYSDFAAQMPARKPVEKAVWRL